MDPELNEDADDQAFADPSDAAGEATVAGANKEEVPAEKEPVESDPIKDFFADTDEEYSEDDDDLGLAKANEAGAAKGQADKAKADAKTPAADEGKPQTPPADAAKKPDAAEVKPEAAKTEGAEAVTPPVQKPEVQAQPAAAGETLTAEQLLTRQREQRQEAENLLAEKHYVFSDEEYEQFEEDPRKFLPKVASRVYMDAVTNSMAHMMQLFPQMLEATLQNRDNNSKYENDFFEMWPDLKEHREDVVRVATTYRSAFPNLSPEQFMREVGAQVMIAKKIVPNGADGNGPGQQAQAPQTPHRPAASAPPARKGGNKPDNFFEALAMEVDENEE